MLKLGYQQDLFVLPFDHRSSFEADLLGIRDRRANAEERERLSQYKLIIYDGFLSALESGVPVAQAAILVDQVYGRPILSDAHKRGIITCVSVERSGQTEFDFEYGEEFGRFLEQANPTFAKALVRYNPDGDSRTNENQRSRLKILSDHVHSTGYKFMLELLVPATTPQLDLAGGDARVYDSRLRPELTVRAIAELQSAQVEPDVWKLEGTEDRRAIREMVAQAQAADRGNVGIIILGRGENKERVRAWLINGAQTEGVIGFAVGRTVFWQPLVNYSEGSISRDEAVARIAMAYHGFCRLFTGARGRSASDDGEALGH